MFYFETAMNYMTLLYYKFPKNVIINCKWFQIRGSHALKSKFRYKQNHKLTLLPRDKHTFQTASFRPPYTDESSVGIVAQTHAVDRAQREKPWCTQR